MVFVYSQITPSFSNSVRSSADIFKSSPYT